MTLMNMSRAARGPLRKRAFSLILVLVVGVAAFAVATTLLIVSESASTRGAHALQGERAEAIAQAGFERTLAYMAPLVEDTGDFDKVLDPDLDVNCSALPVNPPTPSATAGRPAFSDGTPQTYRFKEWTLVPYDDGAYLVRFDDDNDDAHDEPLWVARTGNNLRGTNNCIEGPAALGGGGGGGEGGGEGGGGGGGGGEPADNPFRDRNGAIWITVIGIAPGTDPDRAVHRSTIRRLHHIPTGGVVEGLVVRGNVDIGGNANLDACSPVGSLHVDGNVGVTGSGLGCACGDSRADSFNNFDHCTALAGTCASVGCALGSLDVPGPAVPAVEDWRSAPGADFYFDWSSKCIFIVDDDSESGLWVWDPTAPRGPSGAACSTMQGSGRAFPDINPADTSDFGSCWTPVLLGINDTNPVVSIFPGESSGTEWTPTNAAATRTVDAALNSLLTTEGYPTFPAGAVLNLPDWDADCFVNHPGDGGAHSRCTTCGTGAVAMRPTGPPSNRFWFGSTAAEVNAVPAGMYIFRGGLDLNGGGAMVPPGDPLNMADFPLATLVVEGSLAFHVDTKIGVGPAPTEARFPSIITNGSITYTGNTDQFIAGTVWTTGDWKWSGNGSAILYGELHMNGNWDLIGNGSFSWRYRTALSTPTGGSLNDSAPTTMVSLD